jgi:D-amino-acid dehydrogenase
VHADAVVLSTGAWLPELAKQYGVRTQLRAGRGYSFSVSQPTDRTVRNPIYFPYERIICTPLGESGRIRMGGTMEFEAVDAPLHVKRIESIVANATPLVDGLDLTDRRDEWVGARPVTVDGLPLVGPTDAPGVWVHGGHGMWGMCQGPATARLLAEEITTGVVPDDLRRLRPRR